MCLQIQNTKPNSTPPLRTLSVIPIAGSPSFETTWEEKPITCPEGTPKETKKCFDLVGTLKGGSYNESVHQLAKLQSRASSHPGARVVASSFKRRIPRSEQPEMRLHVLTNGLLHRIASKANRNPSSSPSLAIRPPRTRPSPPTLTTSSPSAGSPPTPARAHQERHHPREEEEKGLRRAEAWASLGGSSCCEFTLTLLPRVATVKGIPYLGADSLRLYVSLSVRLLLGPPIYLGLGIYHNRSSRPSVTPSLTPHALPDLATHRPFLPNLPSSPPDTLHRNDLRRPRLGHAPPPRVLARLPRARPRFGLAPPRRVHRLKEGEWRGRKRKWEGRVRESVRLWTVTGGRWLCGHGEDATENLGCAFPSVFSLFSQVLHGAERVWVRKAYHRKTDVYRRSDESKETERGLAKRIMWRSGTT